MQGVTIDFIITLMIGFFSIFSGSIETLLQQIQQRGELIIATRAALVGYYQNNVEGCPT
jgi:hypothetical protein